LSKSVKNLKKCPFNTIYIEEAAYEYPITQKVLQKYPDCVTITIKHYKDVFNRTNQHFVTQKQHPSLILAVKENQFLYTGPEVCQNFGYSRFYYTSFLLNCLFDCEYCYLQGMYPSANIVAFVNVSDFQSAMEPIAAKEPAYLAVSYDTDLIAFHNIIPYMDYFYDFFKQHSNLFIEIRTKSANQTFYNNHTPMENMIIAFTLAPECVIKNYEKYTPSLESRIQAIHAAINNGFKVRICFDPIFIHPEFDEQYELFFKNVFERIRPEQIIDVGYGFFRISRDFFKRISRQRKNSTLFLEEFSVHNNVVSYSEELQEKVRSKHFEILTQYIEKEKIFSL